MSTTAVRSAGLRPRLRNSPATRIPRRVSGPAHRRAPLSAPGPGATLGARALALVGSLPDRSLVDRLVRGRAWIPVLGVLLAGLVAMQVEILKLGTTMGRSLERASALETENGALQDRVATLSDDQRIERLAAAIGMVMPSPSAVAFLSGHAGGTVGRALANLHPPDPAGFAAQLAAQSAAAAALAPPAVGGTSTASVTSAATSAGTTSATGAASTAGATTPGAGTAPSAGTPAAAAGA